jgi:hypothetical protein
VYAIPELRRSCSKARFARTSFKGGRADHRRVDERGDAGPAALLQQVPVGAVVDVPAGLATRLAHESDGADDRIDAITAAGERPRIGGIGREHLLDRVADRLQSRGVAGQSPHVVPTVLQHPDDVPSQIAGRTGDKNLHFFSFFSSWEFSRSAPDATR